MNLLGRAGARGIMRMVNQTSSDLKLIIEPWAEEYSLPSGDEVILVMEDEDREVPSIEIRDGTVVIWAAYSSIEHNGTVVMDYTNFPRNASGKQWPPEQR